MLDWIVGILTWPFSSSSSYNGLKFKYEQKNSLEDRKERYEKVVSKKRYAGKIPVILECDYYERENLLIPKEMTIKEFLDKFSEKTDTPSRFSKLTHLDTDMTFEKLHELISKNDGFLYLKVKKV